MYAFWGDSSTGCGVAEDQADRLLGLLQGRLAGIHLQREDRGQARLHLDDRVALQHVDREAAGLRFADRAALLAVLGAQRHDDVRLVDVACHDDRQLELTDRLLQALAADPMRQDTDRREDRGGLHSAGRADGRAGRVA